MKSELESVKAEFTELKMKQFNGEYLDDAFRKTTEFAPFTKDFSNEGFKFALAHTRTLWPMMDLKPPKLAYTKVWTTMSSGSKASQEVIDAFLVELDEPMPIDLPKEQCLVPPIGTQEGSSQEAEAYKDGAEGEA